MHATDERIAQIKAQFPDRPLYEVTAMVPKNPDEHQADDEVVCTFIMTAPSRDEHDAYIEKMLVADEKKQTGARDKADSMKEIRLIAQNAAIAQIRWPDADTCLKYFNARPELVDNFHKELRKLAGSLIEFRSKKL